MKIKTNLKKTLTLLIFIIVSQMAGILGSLSTVSSIKTWYVQLNKPSFTPPNWLFAPIWTLLYLLMGISAFLVWNKGIKRKNVKIALTLFFLQLIFNTFWSIIFFGLHLIFLAFIEIILLLITIILMIIGFYRVSKVASYLQIPYFLWVSFAAVLNFSFIILNPV